VKKNERRNLQARRLNQHLHKPTSSRRRHPLRHNLIAKKILHGKRFFLKYVTSGLLAKGYWNTDKTLNVPNLLDLLRQLGRIFTKKAADNYFASGVIELPSGQKQRIFIAQNETGRFTAMLPEEY